MPDIEECFSTLGIPPSSSIEEIKSAYRDLVKVWHPDRFGSDDRLRVKAEEMTKRLNLAFEFLERTFAGKKSHGQSPPRKEQVPNREKLFSGRISVSCRVV